MLLRASCQEINLRQQSSEMVGAGGNVEEVNIDKESEVRGGWKIVEELGEADGSSECAACENGNNSDKNARLKAKHAVRAELFRSQGA